MIKVASPRALGPLTTEEHFPVSVGAVHTCDVRSPIVALDQRVRQATSTCFRTCRSTRRPATVFEKSFTVLAQGLNLTDEVFGFYNGSPWYIIQREYYKPTYSFGLRWEPRRE